MIGDLVAPVNGLNRLFVTLLRASQTTVVMSLMTVFIAHHRIYTVVICIHHMTFHFHDSLHIPIHSSTNYGKQLDNEFSYENEPDYLVFLLHQFQ